jgi:hypothetical protein
MNTNLPEHISILDRMQNWFRLFPMTVLDSLAMALLLAAGVSFLAGLLALAFQAQFWFDHGSWQPITVFAAVYGFLPATFLHWVFDPTDWVRLARALEHFLFWSLWWVLMLLSIAIFYGALAIDKVSHRRRLRYHRMRQNKLREGESQGD